MEIALFIQNIQEERAEVKLFEKSHLTSFIKTVVKVIMECIPTWGNIDPFHLAHSSSSFHQLALYIFSYICHQVALYIFSRNQSNSQSAIEQPDKNRHQNHVVIITIRKIMNMIKIILNLVTMTIIKIMNIVVIVIFIMIQERHCGEISTNRSSP